MKRTRKTGQPEEGWWNDFSTEEGIELSVRKGCVEALTFLRGQGLISQKQEDAIGVHVEKEDTTIRIHLPAGKSLPAVLPEGLLRL